VWFADNGERLGTFNGHNGTVWHLDVNQSSTRVITAGADHTVRLWDMQGKQINQWELKAAVRCVGFAEGEQAFLAVGDKAMKQEAVICLYKMDQQEPYLKLEGHSQKICRALWGDLNQTIASASDDCTVKLWDAETGKEILSKEIHDRGINNLKFSADKTMLITSSKDQTSKLLDARTLEVLKVYKTQQPVNDAVISPSKPHVILGGGQEAMSVTTTKAHSGKFEAHFHHIYLENWLGSVKGHFGPINTLAISPDGKAYASGAEDGYIRIHHFDDEYLAKRHD
jgi:translation initiation factor 3 subunit I